MIYDLGIVVEGKTDLDEERQDETGKEEFLFGDHRIWKALRRADRAKGFRYIWLYLAFIGFGVIVVSFVWLFLINCLTMRSSPE